MAILDHFPDSLIGVVVTKVTYRGGAVDVGGVFE
jgi:hypothetical protein